MFVELRTWYQYLDESSSTPVSRREANGIVAWYLTDGTGSVGEIVRASSGVTLKEQVFAGGVANLSTAYAPFPTFLDRFDFAGQWRFRADLGGNATIDLLHVSGGRFLRPGLGRTLSEDSSTTLAGLPNPGLYANNSWPNYNPQETEGNSSFSYFETFKFSVVQWVQSIPLNDQYGIQQKVEWTLDRNAREIEQAGIVAAGVGEWVYRQFLAPDTNPNSVGEPGFALGFAPAYGPGRTAVNAWQNGRYGSAVVNGAFTIFDLTGVGKIVTGGIRLVGRAAFQSAAREGVESGAKAAGHEVVEQAARTATQNAASVTAVASQGWVARNLPQVNRVADWAVHKQLAKVSDRAHDWVSKQANRLGFEVCFAAGTPIRTPEGSKFIEDFRRGNLVLSRDENTPDGMIVAQTVEEAFVREGLVWNLHVSGQVIRTTAEHPFYVWNKGWTPCNLLAIGDRLLAENGSWLPVEDILDTGEWETVYNLRIAEFHTYFVGESSWGWSVWAHNANYKPPSRPAIAGESGSFSSLRGVKGDLLTPHHMPQAALRFTGYREGGALMLPNGEHLLTRTYGVRGAILAKEEAGVSFRNVLARDIRDIRSIAKSKYNEGLRNLIAYYRDNQGPRI